MKIIILKNGKEACEKAALLTIKEIKKKPNLVLGLATGKTMISFYNSLVKHFNKKEVSFFKVKSFNLDEYDGLGKDDKNSFRHYMDKKLFEKIDIREENIFFLDGKSKNVNKTCKEYDKLLNKNRRDLQILGIGRNGHIGFNEPGSNFKSKTRKIRLGRSTLKDNRGAKKFALTMGIKDIIDAKKIILIATGRGKADAIMNTVKGKINENVPSSILQKHKNVILILDKSAASKL